MENSPCRGSDQPPAPGSSIDTASARSSCAHCGRAVALRIEDSRLILDSHYASAEEIIPSPVLVARVQEAAESEGLDAAWRHIQADFRVAMDRRSRIYDGQLGFWELMGSTFSGGAAKLRTDAEQEVERLHAMLKAIDEVGAAARKLSTVEAPADSNSTV